MPRIIKEVHIGRDREGKVEGALTVDGEPFPFYIHEQPRVEIDAGITYVHVALLADRVVIDSE